MGYTLVGLVEVLLGLILGVEIQARYAAKKKPIYIVYADGSILKEN